MKLPIILKLHGTEGTAGSLVWVKHVQDFPIWDCFKHIQQAKWLISRYYGFRYTDKKPTGSTEFHEIDSGEMSNYMINMAIQYCDVLFPQPVYELLERNRIKDPEPCHMLFNAMPPLWHAGVENVP